MLVNIDLWGSDIGYDSNIHSWEECGQKCLLRSDCDSFTWNSRNKLCIKKRGVPAQRGYEGAFSGTAECLKSSSVSSTIVSDTTTTTGTIVTTSTTGITTGSDVCRTGWTEYDNSCYKVFTDKVSPDSAYYLT